MQIIIEKKLFGNAKYDVKWFWEKRKEGNEFLEFVFQTISD